MATAASDSQDNADNQDELATNIHQRIQDKSNSLTQDSDEVLEMFCEHCEKEQGIIVTARCFCEKCLEYLCSRCLTYHQKYKPNHKTQDHTNMPQDFYIKKCQDHSKELIKFYCMSCQQKACSVCKNNNHRECKIEHIHSIVGSKEFKNEFRKVEKALENDLEAIAESKDNITSKRSNVLILRKDTKASIEKQKMIITKDIEDNFQKCVSQQKQMQTQEMKDYEKMRAILLSKKDKEKDELLAKLDKEKDELLAKLDKEKDELLSKLDSERDELLSKLGKEKDQLINKHQGKNKSLQKERAITIDRMEIEEKKLDKQSESIQIKDEKIFQDLSSKADQIEMKLKHLKQTMSGKMSANQKFEVFLTMQEATHILENTKHVLEEVSQCEVSFYRFEPSTEEVSAFQTNNISYGCIKKQSEIKRNIKHNKSLKFSKTQISSITGLCKISDGHLIIASDSKKSIQILDIGSELITAEENLEDRPFDATLVENNSVATTMPDAKKIQLLSVTDDCRLFLQSQIPVEDKCYGIAFKKPTFIVGFPGKVQMLEINGNVVKTIATSEEIPLQIRLHPDKDAFYIMSINNDKWRIHRSSQIHHGRSNLTKILIDTPTDRIKFKHKFSGDVQGLTIDKSGTIYTTDRFHIIQISDDLQTTHYTHLHPSIEIYESPCLHYCDKENKLYIGTYGEYYLTTRRKTLHVIDVKMA